MEESHQDDAARAQLQDTVKRCFDRAIEAQKARLTADLFLALTTMTMTGYAIQSKQPELLFVAALIPACCLFVDTTMKIGYVIPFLYKALVADLQIAKENSEVLLFLDYSSHQSSPYLALLTLPSEIDRRRAFRSIYLKQTLGIPLLLCGLGSAGELALGIFLS